MRDIINDLSNHFAERISNEDAHNLLSANLRNLYELFINHNHDKPGENGGGIMNGLMASCAGCARPNQNSGYRNFNEFSTMPARNEFGANARNGMHRGAGFSHFIGKVAVNHS